MCKKPPKRRKVGDTLTATVDPADAKVKYAWYTSASTDASAKWTEIDGEDDATLEVTASLKDKFLKVVVTNEAGNTAEAATTSKVAVDSSFDVELVDDYGLQADGTGVVGDQLTVVYGATFGVPQNITWYKNGKVVLTRSIGDTVTNALSQTIADNTKWGAGEYKVTITNVDGEIAETEPITITDKEQPAVIKSFVLEDVYDGETDKLTYAKTDTTAVATVTLNKAYDGKLEIWEKTDTKYTNRIDGVTAPSAASTTSTLTANKKVTSSPVLFIDGDGSAIYKFVVDNGLTRGKEYVLTFDQDEITTDKPGVGEANVTDGATVAPYIEAPAALAITKVANGIAPEVTFQNADGETLGWLASDNAGKTAAQAGLADVQVYGVTSNATTGGDSLKATTASKIVKGVLTANAKAGDTAYFYATAKTTAGIYGKDAITLTSAAVSTAAKAADTIDIVEDSDTPTSAKVSFKNLRSAGTVYVVQGAQNGAYSYWQPADIYSEIFQVSASSATASAAVEKGTASVVLPNAIKPWNKDTFEENRYIAVFVPEDTSDFAEMYTNSTVNFSENTSGSSAEDAGDTNESLIITQAPTDWAIKGDTGKKVGTTEHFTVSVKDQFGQDIATIDSALLNGELMRQANEKEAPFNKKADFVSNATVSVTNTGNDVTVTITNAGSIVGQGAYVALPGAKKQYLYAECVTGGTAAAAKYKFTIGTTKPSDGSTTPTYTPVFDAFSNASGTLATDLTFESKPVDQKGVEIAITGNGAGAQLTDDEGTAANLKVTVAADGTLTFAKNADGTILNAGTYVLGYNDTVAGKVGISATVTEVAAGSALASTAVTAVTIEVYEPVFTTVKKVTAAAATTTALGLYDQYGVAITLSASESGTLLGASCAADDFQDDATLTVGITGAITFAPGTATWAADDEVSFAFGDAIITFIAQDATPTWKYTATNPVVP